MNGSRVIIIKWSNQVGVPYYKPGIKYKHMSGSATTAFHTFAAASSLYLSADNATRGYCVKTNGGRCPEEFARFSQSFLGPGRQWTYGSEVEVRAGACSSNESSSCLMSSFKTFIIPLGGTSCVRPCASRLGGSRGGWTGQTSHPPF